MHIDISATLPDGRNIAALSIDERVEEWFSCRTPYDYQLEAYDELRREARTLARSIVRLCPACADQSAALRKLRECVMTANAAIATKGV